MLEVLGIILMTIGLIVLLPYLVSALISIFLLFACSVMMVTDAMKERNKRRNK